MGRTKASALKEGVLAVRKKLTTSIGKKTATVKTAVPKNGVLKKNKVKVPSVKDGESSKEEGPKPRKHNYNVKSAHEVFKLIRRRKNPSVFRKRPFQRQVRDCMARFQDDYALAGKDVVRFSTKSLDMILQFIKNETVGLYKNGALVMTASGHKRISGNHLITAANITGIHLKEEPAVQKEISVTKDPQ